MKPTNLAGLFFILKAHFQRIFFVFSLLLFLLLLLLLLFFFFFVSPEHFPTSFSGFFLSLSLFVMRYGSFSCRERSHFIRSPPLSLSPLSPRSPGSPSARQGLGSFYRALGPRPVAGGRGHFHRDLAAEISGRKVSTAGPHF